MKKINNDIKKSFGKKIFVKICRLLGYEIIDQNNLHIPTSNKSTNDDLSIQGKRSISLPLGEVKITRPVKSLDIIIKTCTNINLVTQSKKRIFEKEKSEYTFRSINSLIKSINYAKKKSSNISFKIYVIDNNSRIEHLKLIEDKLINSTIPHEIIKLNVSDFENEIVMINQTNQNFANNMKSTMSSIYKSFLLAKKNSTDLIYFVEDDYIHQNEAIIEMLLTYEKISSQSNRELIICPSDYPFLYNKIENTQIYIGNKRHWRVTGESLLTFMISKKLIEKHWDLLENMCKIENSPFEKNLHKIYEEEICLSPIPSLAMHCTNINSVFGIPPNFDWKQIWDENEDPK